MRNSENELKKIVRCFTSLPAGRVVTGKIIIVLIGLLMLFVTTMHAQTNTFPLSGSVGIGTTNPDASAILDVTSTTQGVLLPRMTKTQRNAIVAPAQGLLIYQTNATSGLYYYDGAWTPVSNGANKLLSNLTAPTSLMVDLLPAATNTISLGSSTQRWKDVNLFNLIFSDGSTQSTAFIPYTSGAGISIVSGVITNTARTQWTTTGNNIYYTSGNVGVGTSSPSAKLDVGGDARVNGVMIGMGGGSIFSNTVIGKGSMLSNTTGGSNSTLGYLTLNSNTTGFSNVALGTGAMKSNTVGYNMVAVGDSALFSETGDPFSGYFNTAVGSKALFANTYGIGNTACGFNALYSNVFGSQNTSCGSQALYTNTGNGNTAIGWHALYSNTEANYNTATGTLALWSNTTGYSNTSNGSSALGFNTTGYSNTATGHSNLYSNTTGNSNTATGDQALYANTTGSQNTAAGGWAIANNTTGNNNTALGYNANVSSGGLINTTAIGFNAIVDTNNKVSIGNSSITSNGGQVSWTSYSDARIKNNVAENVPGLNFINELRPVTFHFDVKKENGLLGVKEDKEWQGKYDIEKIQFTGFIAQEVDAAAKKINYDFSGVDKNGKVMGLRYAEFVVPLVKAIQELDENQRSEVGNRKSKEDSLQFAVYSLQKENAKMKNQIAQLQSSIDLSRSSRENQQSSMSTGFAKLQTLNAKPETLLGQNIPNPFDNSTIIPFRIPKNCHDASIMITNTSTSEVINVIPISCNEDHLSIDAGQLASGTYSYTLYVDGSIIDTKNMVLTK